MEQLESLRLDSEPYPMDYEPTIPTHYLIIYIFTYLVVLMAMMRYSTYQSTFPATVRH